MNAKFYVPFETAKLLKEKGYPQVDSDMYYNPKGKLKNSDEITGIYTIVEFARRYVAAPAYCEVLDWLAEKDIDVDVYMTVDNTFFCSLWEHGENEYYLGELPTREQAINEAITKALEEMI